jgi:putative permease
MNRSQQETLQRNRRLRIAFFIILLLLSFAFVVFVDNMMIALVLAFVSNYMLGPWVNALERAGLARGIATVLVFVIAAVILTLGCIAALPVFAGQVERLHSELPQYIGRLPQLFATVEERMRMFNTSYFSIDVSGKLQHLLTQWTENIFDSIPTLFSRLLTILLLGPLLSFFMIKDGRVITRRIMALVPNSLFELVLSLYHQINEQLGQFVRARLLEAVIVGLMTWWGLMILQFPFAFLFGAIAGIANLIPYIGPIVGAIPALALAAVNGLPAVSIFLVLLVYVIAQLVDVALIIPFVVAKVVNLHPLTVVLSLLVGAQAMGLIGSLISIPLASVIKVTSSAVYQYIVEH